MNMLNNAKAWVMARWSERTSWDGGLIVGLSLSYLLLGGLVDLVAWVALAYGIYTFVKKEV
jgi:hypothetical protein